jgi:outer membrane lipoprotein-sorting protein
MLQSRRFLGRLVVFVTILLALPLSLFAQQILTALEYFDSVAINYAELDDYIATVTWTDESGSMTGTIYHKQPNLIRIDFEVPEDQVYVSNGEILMIYVPAFNVVLQQELRDTPTESAETLASEQGLALMRRNFNIAYLEGPEPVPLDEGCLW